MRWIAGLCICGALLLPRLTEARDLSKTFGFGWAQIAHIEGNENGVDISYSPMDSLRFGTNAASRKNADSFIAGGYVRYDLNSLLTARLSPWSFCNVYAKLGIYGRFGSETKGGLTFQTPFIGFEVFPFREAELSISSEWGLIIDLVSPDSIAIGTNVEQLASLGVKFYL